MQLHYFCSPIAMQVGLHIKERKGKERKDISISKDILVEKQVLRPDV